MKRYLNPLNLIGLFALVFLFSISCSSTQKLTGTNSPEIKAGAQDTTQYEILFFDNDFETWFAINQQPKSLYPESYYAAQNRINSQQWNSAVISNNYRSPFSYEIDYSPNIDYGLDVNYKLFYYFKYLETIVGPIDALP